jgi:hypothetical protein
MPSTDIRPARGLVLVLLVLAATASLLWTNRAAVGRFAAALNPSERDMKRYRKRAAKRSAEAAKARKRAAKDRADYIARPLTRARANQLQASLTLAGSPSRKKG